ncbi:metallophosphoesterase family protein [Alcaligenes sp. SDU_A2]|uniref:metallophosphoesterase family protein n=1 Tax=Alcaligenes sp. SDU_A2 TaxID=3136634 RepID=UPI00311FA7C6
MKIAAISDIHGNLPALQAVLQDIDTQRVDLTVNLGDILSGPLQPAETADLLMPLTLPTLRGNHERQLLTQARPDMGASDRFAHEQLTTAHLDWLDSLPTDIELGDDILLTHGAPGDDLQYLLETLENGKVRAATHEEIIARLGKTRHPVVLCGHTHIPRIVSLPDGRLLVNPGSVGLQAYHSDQPQPHIVQTGSPHARYAIIEQTDKHWSAQLRCVPYDHHSAAQLAEQRQRHDWAQALRSGTLS